LLFTKELVYISFDEKSAKVSGIPVRLINTLLVVLSALTMSLAIPIVGVLLIATLIVILVVTALQFGRSFTKKILYAECVSLFSVISGIFTSFYFDLSTGGTIVLFMLLIFIVVIIMKNIEMTRASLKSMFFKHFTD